MHVTARLVSIQAALPSYVAAFSGEGNPASAEALKAAEVTKNKRAERKVTVFVAPEQAASATNTP